MIKFEEIKHNEESDYIDQISVTCSDKKAFIIYANKGIMTLHHLEWRDKVTSNDFRLIADKMDWLNAQDKG